MLHQLPPSNLLAFALIPFKLPLLTAWLKKYVGIDVTYDNIGKFESIETKDVTVLRLTNGLSTAFAKQLRTEVDVLFWGALG